jgi:hypothetical protein
MGTVNVSNGQAIFAKGKAKVKVKQINNAGVNVKDLEYIVKCIKENLSELSAEDAESIEDVVDIAKEELSKPAPKASRLRNCVTLLAPMFTIANGVPALVSNLQKLMDYINPYI